ncbi:MAG: hypothetical protein WBX27_10535 [Specibacter sp.]
MNGHVPSPVRACWGRTTAVARLAALGALALGLAGCNPVSHYLPGSAALQDKVDCKVHSEWRPNHGLIDPASQLMGSVPQGFIPVDVIRCDPASVHVSEDLKTSSWTLTEDHLSGNYTALLAAVAEPSDKQDGIACTADAEILPELWLVNAGGKAVHVMWPLDVCSKSKPDTAKALAGLRVSSTKTLTAVAP